MLHRRGLHRQSGPSGSVSVTYLRRRLRRQSGPSGSAGPRSGWRRRRLHPRERPRRRHPPAPPRWGWLWGRIGRRLRPGARPPAPPRGRWLWLWPRRQRTPRRRALKQPDVDGVSAPPAPPRWEWLWLWPRRLRPGARLPAPPRWGWLGPRRLRPGARPPAPPRWGWLWPRRLRAPRGRAPKQPDVDYGVSACGRLLVSEPRGRLRCTRPDGRPDPKSPGSQKSRVFSVGLSPAAMSDSDGGREVDESAVLTLQDKNTSQNSALPGGDGRAGRGRPGGWAGRGRPGIHWHPNPGTRHPPTVVGILHFKGWFTGFGDGAPHIE